MHAVFALVYVEYAVGVLELKLDSMRILARMVVSEVLTRPSHRSVVGGWFVHSIL